MSKKPKYDFTKANELLNQYEKERKKMVSQCSHQNEKGKIKIDPVGKSGDYKCKFCKDIFNMNVISENDIKEARETLHNAIQQIRCFADQDDDHKLVVLLGELDLNLENLPELYKRYVNIYGKGNNKNRHNNHRDEEDDYGSFGAGSLSFISSKNKNKKK